MRKIFGIMGALILMFAAGALAQNYTDTFILSGEQQVPPVDTTASGEGMWTLEGDLLTVTGDFEELTSDLLVVGDSSAHVHAADFGESGPVLYPLAVDVQRLHAISS